MCDFTDFEKNIYDVGYFEKIVFPKNREITQIATSNKILPQCASSVLHLGIILNTVGIWLPEVRRPN